MAEQKVSDRGGWPGGPIDRSLHEKAIWERRTDAILMILARKGIARIDEHRRAMEEMGRERYESLTYYQRWIAAIEMLLLEKGLATREEIDRATST